VHVIQTKKIKTFEQEYYSSSWTCWLFPSAILQLAVQIVSWDTCKDKRKLWAAGLTANFFIISVQLVMLHSLHVQDASSNFANVPRHTFCTSASLQQFDASDTNHFRSFCFFPIFVLPHITGRLALYIHPIQTPCSTWNKWLPNPDQRNCDCELFTPLGHLHHFMRLLDKAGDSWCHTVKSCYYFHQVCDSYDQIYFPLNW
jgi:hypothetical protein